MKLNKHVMAMNLAAVIAFGAVAGIVAPSIVGEDSIVAYAAEKEVSGGEVTGGDVTGGDAKQKEQEASKKAGEKVTIDEKDPAAEQLKNVKLTYNGDGKTAKYVTADKAAKKIVVPESFKNAAGDVITITAIDPSAFDGAAATEIDISKVKLEKLVSKQFKGASKVKTIKINGEKLKAKNINKNFVKGNKKLKTVKVVATKKQYKKLEKKLKAAALKTKYKKGTKVKRSSK